MFAVYIAWHLLLVALSSSVGNLVVPDRVRSLWWNMDIKLGGSQLRAEPVGRLSVPEQSERISCRLDAAETPYLPYLDGQVLFPGVTHRVIKRCPKSWRTARNLIRLRLTRRSEQMTNCVKFSRTCQMNTNRSSTVTGIEMPILRVKWWYWTQSSLHAYLDTAAWISKAKKPSRGVCRTQPQKRDAWRRNASKKRMSYSLICLWFWIRFIAVPFYLTLSRVGEAENPGPVCATAKLFGAKYDAIGLWAQNLSNRSEVELEPLFVQVGECRQMFSERFGKDSKLYTSSVSTHSHLDRSSLPVPTERNEVLAHTQQFL